MWMPTSNMMVLSFRVTQTQDRPTSCPAPRHRTCSCACLSCSEFSSINLQCRLATGITSASRARDLCANLNDVTIVRFITVSEQNQINLKQFNYNAMITYVHPEAEANFKNFKYSGGNDSITYEYIWSPLADKLIKYVPTNIAPNLITFSSLLLLSLSHLLFMSGDNSKGVATWKLLLMAASLFVYQNLDNLDGKQARRTNSSSPLGMLFDHGTDAVASFLISIQVIEFLQLQDTFLRVAVVFVFVMLVYFSAMWAQYSTGHFRLGRVNPVDEGLPGYAIAALANIFLPQGFWNFECALGKYNHCLIYALFVLLVMIIYYMVRDNFKNAVRTQADIKRALLLPASYAATLALLKIFKPQVYLLAYYPLCYVLMFTWSRNMIEIQVYFVTKQTFNPFNYGTLTFLIPSALYLFPGTDPVTYFWTVAVIAGVVFFEFVISVLLQGSRILGIYVFSLEKRVVPKDRLI